MILTGSPGYLYPSGGTFGLGTPAVFIANPASGPGWSANSDWTTALSGLAAAGTTVIGYVSTSYTNRPLIQVKGDIDVWYTLYPMIKGIFFDEASPECSNVDYYRQAVAYAASKGAAFTTLNPGGPTSQCYDGVATAIMSFENTFTVYAGFTPPAWEATAKSLMWHVVHTDGCRNFDTFLALASARGADLIWATDDDNTPAPGMQWGNPYDSVPSCLGRFPRGLWSPAPSVVVPPVVVPPRVVPDRIGTLLDIGGKIVRVSEDKRTVRVLPPFEVSSLTNVGWTIRKWTKTDVRAFQTANGLKADGVYGAKTRAAIGLG